MNELMHMISRPCKDMASQLQTAAHLWAVVCKELVREVNSFNFVVVVVDDAGNFKLCNLFISTEKRQMIIVDCIFLWHFPSSLYSLLSSVY